MWEFFNSVLGYLDVAWTNFSNTLNNVLQALIYISSSVESILRVLGFMPLVVGSCGLIVVVFAVVKFVIGR